MSTTPYWLAESPEPLPRTQLDGPAEVAVVGGGITGCSCALALAEAGVRVRLYEAREIAGGASGRNGGLAPPRGAGPYPVTGESIGGGRAAARGSVSGGALPSARRRAPARPVRTPDCRARGGARRRDPRARARRLAGG